MAPLDLVLRELGDIDARLADLATGANGSAVQELRARLLTCVRALTEADVDARGGLIAEPEVERGRYRELFEEAPGPYLLTDGAATIVTANAAAGKLFGVEPGDLTGMSLAGFVTVAERTSFRELLGKLARAEASGEHEFTLEREGRTFAAALTVGHVHEGGRVDSLRWLVRDVTERRLAEEESRRLAAELEERARERTRELDRERSLLEAVILQMPAGVAITDAGTGELLITNEQAREIARARFEESEGLGPLLHAVSAGLDTGTGVVETVGPDGEPGAIEVNAAPLRDGDGRVTARVAVFRDVTTRERLERAEREFITNAAHELQTPLTAITSAAEVLQAGAKDTPADRDRFLTHIQRECDRLARLVRALLVLARAQSQGRAAEAETLMLRPLLQDVAAGLRPAEGVQVEVVCSPRLSALANRDLTEQAVSSLGGNAAKFTAKGSIRLSARRLDGERVAVEVTDTGTGIADTERELVRQRFYRGGRRDRTGFGLGLAIAEQAAHALGGALELDGAPGGGTIARLVLPGRARP